MFKTGFINEEALQAYAAPRCKVALLGAEGLICTSSGGSEGSEEEDW